MTFHQMHLSTPWWIKVLAPIILTGSLSGIVSMYQSYTHNDREIIQRVTALETGRKDDTDHLNRIENKLDQLVAWALGK